MICTFRRKFWTTGNQGTNLCIKSHVVDYLTKESGQKVLTSRRFEDQESAAKVADLLGAYLYDNWEYLTDDGAEKFKTLTQSQLKKKVLKELMMKVKGRRPRKSVVEKDENGNGKEIQIPYVFSLSLCILDVRVHVCLCVS